MKVEFLCYNAYGIGGTVRTVISQANWLVRHGVDVTVVSMRRQAKAPRLPVDSLVVMTALVDYSGGHKHSAPETPSAIIHPDDDFFGVLNSATDKALLHHLDTADADILVSTFPAMSIVLSVHRPPQAIVIAQEHKEYRLHSPQLQRDLVQAYASLDCLVALTETEAATYRQLLGPDVFVAVVPNAVELQDRSGMRDRRVIITGGRLSEQKAFHKLVSAFATIAEDLPDWEVRIYGSGDAIVRKALLSQIDDLGLDGKVLLLPSSPRFFDELARASIFASTSTWESFGMIIAEAMSVGVPTVAFETKGARQLLSGGGGLVVEQDNVSAFGAALRRLALSEEERKRMGSVARMHVARYSQDAVGVQWLQLFSQLRGRAQ